MKNYSYIIDFIFMSISGTFLLTKIQTLLSFLIVVISFILVVLKLIIEYKKYKQFNKKINRKK